MATTTATSDTSKRNLILGGSIAGLVLLIFIGGPIISASSWKSDALDKTNTTIDKVNSTNRDISTFTNKLQPTDDDYTKVIKSYEEQNTALTNAKNQLNQVGGISVVDVTGEYKKASDARNELIGAYDEMLSLNSIGMARVKAEQDVSKLFGEDNAMETNEQLQAAIKSFRDAASKINAFALTSNGTDNDKKTAAAFTSYADALQALLDGDAAGDNAKVNAATTKIDQITTELDTLSQQSIKDQEDLQKKFDKNIDRLNAAAKALE